MLQNLPQTGDMLSLDLSLLSNLQMNAALADRIRTGDFSNTGVQNINDSSQNVLTNSQRAERFFQGTSGGLSAIPYANESN